jgi:hypothetical protein
MKSAKATVLGLSIIVMMTAAAPLVSAQAAHVRWDMISVNFGPPVSLNPGGSATAIASDGSTITITGSGTFVSPANWGIVKRRYGRGNMESRPRQWADHKRHLRGHRTCAVGAEHRLRGVRTHR